MAYIRSTTSQADVLTALGADKERQEHMKTKAIWAAQAEVSVVWGLIDFIKNIVWTS